MRTLIILLLASAAHAATIAESMQEQIDKQQIPGAVTLVANKSKVVHLEAIGSADPDGKRPMKTDTIFWIASMTKPITAAAVLMLQEAGKLSIDDPASKYIPEYAGLKTKEGKSAVITLRHMLTHTSGLSEATEEEQKSAKTLAQLVPAFASKPLNFEPGSRWQYCQSGINSLGRIVEIVSGESFENYLQKHFFRPLRMTDTTFYLSERQMPRLVTPAKLENGKLIPGTISLLHGLPPTSRDHYPAANGGLFSTASDYVKFAQMLLNDGTLNGRRYLKPETVKLMRTIDTGSLTTGFTPGNGWGLGVCVVRDPQGITQLLSPGAYGHGGAYGTQVWIDPVQDKILLLLIQRTDLGNSDGSPIRAAFQAAALTPQSFK